MNKRLLIGVIINALVIILILGTYLSSPSDIESAGNTNKETVDFNNITNDTNITLIKANTYGNLYKYNESKPYTYNYFVEGVLLNLPPNTVGYDLNTKFYDENDKFLYQNHGTFNWKVDNFAKSQPCIIGSWSTDKPQNISKVEINVVNPLGETVFNETVKFDMDKFDYSRKWIINLPLT